MSEIKTAAIWAVINKGYLQPLGDNNCMLPSLLATMVSGASESDILAGLDLLKKSRDVCEFTETGFDLGGAIFGYLACSPDENNVLTKFCPSCGRAVKITEGE